MATSTSRLLVNSPDTGNEAAVSIPGPISGPGGLKLKQKLKDVVMAKRPRFDATEQEIAPLLFNYYDTLYCERTVATSDSLRRMAALHALNHVFKQVRCQFPVYKY